MRRGRKGTATRGRPSGRSPASTGSNDERPKAFLRASEAWNGLSLAKGAPDRCTPVRAHTPARQPAHIGTVNNHCGNFLPRMRREHRFGRRPSVKMVCNATWRGCGRSGSLG